MNIDNNISIVIGSCLIHQKKFDCLCKVLDNLNHFLPGVEIIVGFDNVGPNKLQEEILNKYKNVTHFTHKKGLGFSFNEGTRLSKNDIILQTEDDWIIQNKYLNTQQDVNNLLFKCSLVLQKHPNSCVRLDGGMFDEIGGHNGYPLGWKKHRYGSSFNYYEYNLPSKEQIDDNGWLHYAFCNHPHMKFKKSTLDYPYPECVNPAILENEYSVSWILRSYPIFYVPINEESIKVFGPTNPDKNIFKHIGSDCSYRA